MSAPICVPFSFKVGTLKRFRHRKNFKQSLIRHMIWMSDEKSVKIFKVSATALLIASTLISLVILFTDKNLQTDFGSVTRYYYHWYGMLILALITLIAAIITIGSGENKARISAFLGSFLPILGIIYDLFFQYKQAGFSSYQQFGTYLFGVSKYPGTLSYIPGLFDFYTAVLLISLIISLVWLLSKGTKENKSNIR